MEFEEIIEVPGFWILGSVGTIMVVIGWIMSKNMEAGALPLWQILLTIIVIWIASGFFASRD